MSAVHGCMCSLTDKISIDESAQLRGTEAWESGSNSIRGSSYKRYLRPY